MATNTVPADPAHPSGNSREQRYRQVQTILFAVGAVLMPAGVGAVFFGWYGAAHTKYAYDQFPYLLSGGLMGVCLTTLGGFIYFGAWQAKVAQEQRSAARQVATTMALLADLVAKERAVETGAEPVVAGENGATVHRRDCTLIAKRDDLRPVTASDAGLSRCRVCNPA